jgi:hypothetical protein
MAGGRREEEAAERLGKPASGTVVGGMGPADEPPGTTGELDRATGETWTLSTASVEGMQNPMGGTLG